MYKSCLKTYWKTLKYAFMVLGIIFLVLLISGSVIEAGAVKHITNLTENIKTVTGDTDLSFDRVKDAIDSAIRKINPKETVEDIKSNKIEEKAQESVLGAISGVIGNYVKYAAKIAALVAATLVAFSVVIVVALLVLIFGIILSHDITYILARYELVKDDFLEIWLELLLKSMVQIFALAIVLVPVILIKPYGLVLLAGYPLLYCYLSLLSAWITAGEERPSYKEICSFKNVAIMLGANATMLAISAVITFLFIILGNIVIGFIAGLTLIIMNLVAFSLNGTVFIKNDMEEVAEA